MKLKSATIIFFCFTFNFGFAQQKNIKVTFSLHSPGLADTAKVYITGSLPELGTWNPSKVQMKAMGKHNWVKEITISSAKDIEYKYTLGSWEREGGDANGLPLPNFNVNVKSDTIIKDDVLFWLNRAASKPVPHHITGTVKYLKNVKGAGLADRDIAVWLPLGYDWTKDERYPVLYMQDGQNIFDPATSSFGVEWRVDETCDSLIKSKALPPLIVVGIYNTANRTEEYTPGDTGKAYMNFVVTKVKRLIDSMYRTKPDRNNTFVGGSSYGGLISFMLAWEYPQVFSHAICMSPAFVSHRADYVKTVTEYKGARKDVTFYIDCGGLTLDVELKPGIDLMMKALDEKGYVKDKDYIFVFDPNAKHSEAYWAERFPGAVKWCFNR